MLFFVMKSMSSPVVFAWFCIVRAMVFGFVDRHFYNEKHVTVIMTGIYLYVIVFSPMVAMHGF